jgi:hypothetical protein
MFTRRVIYSLAATSLALAAIEARAADPPPTPPPTLFDGRYFQVVIANRISWEEAKAAAESRSHLGIQGHLATIGSQAEDDFVDQLRQQTLNLPHPPLSGTQLWVGGDQLPCATTTSEPGCGWVWINGESIAPQNSASPYTNWQEGEPNNRRSDDHLTIGQDGLSGWNDENNLSKVWGYVIEYGDKFVVPATSCTSANGGCNPTGAQFEKFPASAQVAAGSTLTARTYRFHDDPNRCGKEPRTLFDGAVVIPAYLCGHPDFLVIETATSGVEIPSGVIEVENLTEDVLPDNLYGCTGDIDPDPSHRDVVAWQAADPQAMLETEWGEQFLSSGPNPHRYSGALTEVTNGCGSSRGGVLQGSYHFVGLRIHPGPGNELIDGNPEGNHQSFVELTRYKLEVLQASVDVAQPDLPGASYVALKSHVKNAIQFHDRGDYDDALKSIRSFLKEVALSKYRAESGKNPSGDHLMRGSNIEFMYTEKVIPFER